MTLNDLLKQLSDLIAVDMTLLRIILAMIFIFVGLIFREIFVKGIMRLLLHLTKKTKTNLDEMLVYALEKPSKSLILGFSIWLAISILGLPAALQHFLNLAFRTFFILMLFWFFYRASDSLVLIFERFLDKNKKKTKPVLIGFMRKTLKILFIIIEVFMIIKEWGYDVSGLLAGLGVGGLALSLAAKDAASNLLGSIAIMIDKTYSIGDWIQTEKVEGTVEEIGFRSTKLRTFADAIISVPNSIMSNEPITNWSKMGKRRVSFNLQVPLDTSAEKLEDLLDKIRKMLKKHEDISHDTIVAQIEGFGEGTLQLLFYFFTKTTSWVTFLAVKEDVNLKIMYLFEEMNIPIAVPVKRIQLEGPWPALWQKPVDEESGRS